ncbi:MAG: uracil-DNA glycosylase family protein [Alphaproteobacteria bacterium]
MHNKTLLKWYCDAGVDEATGNTPRNWYAQPASSAIDTHEPAPEKMPQRAHPLHHTPLSAISAARAAADACHTLEELKNAVMQFEGCPLKKTAGKTVFADGTPAARVMIIGEAPGSEEDKQGIPFCGPSGQLLDKMVGAIGLTRAESVYISNTVFWRPPGNRQPSQDEAAICMPFVEKHIALINPTLLILAGGVAAKALLSTDQPVSRLRGKLMEYSNAYLASPVKATVLYHPSYLLRTPAQKRLAWRDLQFIRDFLADVS